MIQTAGLCSSEDRVSVSYAADHSNPVKAKIEYFSVYAPVAQRIEHSPPKRRVARSTRARRATNNTESLDIAGFSVFFCLLPTGISSAADEVV